jgi:hypothetical protein
LFPLHLEDAALELDLPLKALEGLALLLEGKLLARARDAEHHQLALELRELRVSALQRFLRLLAGDALLLQRRPGVGKGSPLLLELPFSPLAGVALLQEPVLRDSERRSLGVEGGLQIVGLLGLLLKHARPLLSLALLSLRPPEQRVELQVVVADAGHLRLPVGARVRVFSRSARACRSVSSRSMRAVQTR